MCMRSGEAPQGKSLRGARGRGKGKGAHAVRQGAAGKKPARHAWARQGQGCACGPARCCMGKARAARVGAARVRVRMRSGKMPQGKAHAARVGAVRARGRRSKACAARVGAVRVRG